MTDELKPCPFCGSGATFEAHATADEIDPGVICRTMAVIGCESCEFLLSEETDEKAVTKWNTRAAATEEQFSMAVHNGEAWQRVRTCRFTLEEDREKLAEKADCGPGEFVTQDMPQLLWTCSACGVQYRNSFDVLPDWMNHCPECGAKVVEAAPC